MDVTFGSLFKEGFLSYWQRTETNARTRLQFFFACVFEESSNGFFLNCFIKKMNITKPFDSL